MVKLKVYLDTSVISAYFDMQKSLRREITRKWFLNEIINFIPFVSALVIDEISAHPDESVGRSMLNLLNCHAVGILELNEEISRVAALYRKNIIPREVNDSIHLATASYYPGFCIRNR